MTDEDFKNLEHTVERHHGEFDLTVKRIEELENDLKIVVRYSGSLQHAIIDAASGADLVEIKRLRDKYGIRIGDPTPAPITPTREREVQGFDAVNPIQSSTRLDKRSIDLLEILESEHCIRTRFYSSQLKL